MIVLAYGSRAQIVTQPCSRAIDDLRRARLIYQAYIGQIMMVPAPADEQRTEWVEVFYPMLVAGAPHLKR